MEVSAMDGLEEKIMAIKLRFALPVLAAIISLGFIGITRAAPGGGVSEILEVDVDYELGRLTIEGTGFDDGTALNEPIVTLGGYLLTDVIFTHLDPTIGPDTIQGDIDLESLFLVTGDYLLIVDPNVKKAKTSELILTIQGSSSQPPAHPSSNTGDIIGSVDICDLLGIDQVIVYIPGRSFVVRPALDGNFEMNFVPPGTYDIFMQAYDGEVVSTLSGVVVSDKQQTDLGVISVCIDADGDGYDATEDCNDGNIDINPGAVELCNAIDDNCDGTIDDGWDVTVFWRDSDHDNFGDPNDTLEACITPNGYVSTPGDCDDGNANVRPNQSQYFTQSSGGSYDYNCNNVEEFEFNGTRGLCRKSGTNCVSDVIEGSGYWINVVPDCGVTGGRLLNCREITDLFGILLSCETDTFTETQACR
jgi:hypothetical protein